MSQFPAGPPKKVVCVLVTWGPTRVILVIQEYQGCEQGESCMLLSSIPSLFQAGQEEEPLVSV